MSPALRQRLARLSNWRFYALQRLRQGCKGLVCKVVGHDTAPRLKPDGSPRARVWKPGGYRCHRCWQAVPETRSTP